MERERNQSSDDDEYHKPDLIALEEMMRMGVTESSSHNVSAGSSQLLQQAARATTIQVNLELQDETVEAQIERAAVRHRIRKDRLHAVQKRAPEEVEASGVQTDPQLTKYVPDSLGVEKEKKKSFGTQSGSSSAAAAAAREASAVEMMKNRSEGLVLTPQVPYTPVALQATLREDDTVWRKLAIHESNLALKQHPSAAQETRNSSSNAQPHRNDDGMLSRSSAASGPSGVSGVAGRGSATDTGSGPSPIAEAKMKLMSQLDRMQLENEELLVRNRVIDTTTRPTDASEKKLLKGAIAHVGVAYKPDVDVPALGPPQGGYGSIGDGTGSSSFVEIQPPGSAPSWANIRQQNDFDTANSTTVEPLRRWATDLAAVRHEPVVTVFPSSRSSLKSPSSTVNQAIEYNARRKWQNVSFATAQQNQQELPPGMLDSLSSNAKSMMTPSS